MFIPIFLLLTGCYNYREINDLAIATGISISKTENNQYQLTVEIVNPKKQQDTSSSNEPDFIIYTAKGQSIQEIFRKLIKESPQKIYSAQLEIMILDESLAEEDLKNVIDFFARDPEIRSEFYVLVGKESKILETITPLENLSSKNILDSLKANNNYLGIANLVTYHELMNNFLNPRIELALPSIEIVENESIPENEGEKIENIGSTQSEVSSVLSNIAVFKENQFLGYLTEEQSKAYNFAMGNIKTVLIKTNYENDQFVVNELIHTSSDTEVDVDKNKVTIKIKAKAAISEVKYDCDLTKEETIQKIQKDLNKTVENSIENSIYDIIQTYNSDIFGFQDLFYKKDPKKYKTIKDTWYEKIFPNLEIEVKSDIQIFEKGNLNGGSYHEEK